MDLMEKFYSDASKLVKNCPPEKFNEELSALFCRAVLTCDKRAAVLANDLACCRLNFVPEVNGTDKKEQMETVEWLYKIFALLTGKFQKDMDFTADDWEQINITVSEAAYELDIELLNSIMSVIVERKKI